MLTHVEFSSHSSFEFYHHMLGQVHPASDATRIRVSYDDKVNQLTLVDGSTRWEITPGSTSHSPEIPSHH